MDLVPEQIYRRRDLHSVFGGQRQGGISTPAGKPVILIFTGYGGTAHGYVDHWQDNVFCYFGEGRKGDMRWIKGNAAIRDHANTGKDLLIFQMLKQPRAHVKFMGGFAIASWEYRRAPDRAGNRRQAIVFHLVPIALPLPELPLGFMDLDALRLAAQKAGSDAPNRKASDALRTYFERATAVQIYALARAGGKCEWCGRAAPFVTKSGQPFLEVHHLRRLADGGPDRYDAVAALCPNCHKEAHHGMEGRSLNHLLERKVWSIEHSE